MVSSTTTQHLALCLGNDELHFCFGFRDSWCTGSALPIPCRIRQQELGDAEKNDNFFDLFRKDSRLGSQEFLNPSVEFEHIGDEWV